MESLRRSRVVGVAKDLYGKIHRAIPRAYRFVVFKGHQLIADLVGLFVAFCTIRTPLLKKIDDALGTLPPRHPARKELKHLRKKVADTDARHKAAKAANPDHFDDTPFHDEVQAHGKELDNLAARHPDLAEAIAPSNSGPATSAKPDVVFVKDPETGLTIEAEGRITGSHRGRKKGSLPEPEGGRSSGEHRGHLIPEGGVQDPSKVNIRENLISEAAGSNLGPKKSFDLRASRIADENPGREVRTRHRPLRRPGETRPYAVEHWIEMDGQKVYGITIFNQ